MITQEVCALYACRHKRRSGLKIGAVPRNGIFVPFEADARFVGNVQHAVLDLVLALEDRIRPILPFEPMRSLGDAHHVARR